MKGTLDNSKRKEKITSVDLCTGLKTAWSNMVADKQFPVGEGTVLTLSCKAGYQLSGGKEVICSKDTDSEFQFSIEPRCGNNFNIPFDKHMFIFKSSY